MLPADIWYLICDFLELADILRLSQTSKELYTIVNEAPHLWKCVDLSSFAHMESFTLDRVLILLKKKSLHIKQLQLNGIRDLPESQMLAIIKMCDRLEQLHLNVHRYPYYELFLWHGTEYSEHEQIRFQTAPGPLISAVVLKALPETLTGLSLAFRSIDKLQLLEMFGKLSQLRHIDLRRTEIDNDSVQELLRLRGNQLLSLRLMNVPLTHLSLLSLRVYGKNIKALELSYCFAKNSSAKQVGEAICEMNLEELNLTRMPFVMHDQIIQSLSSQCRIRKLILTPWEYAIRDYHLDLTQASFLAISDSPMFDQLEELRLDHSAFITDADMIGILQNRQNTLRILDIRFCPLLSTSPLSYMLHNKLPRLEKLILHNWDKATRDKSFSVPQVKYTRVKVMSLRECYPKSKQIDAQLQLCFPNHLY